MNEIAKVLSSLLLLGAGFVGASMFGPPDLVDQFAAQWKPVPQVDPQSLRPLEAGVPAAPAQLALGQQPMGMAQATPLLHQQTHITQKSGAPADPIRQMASLANYPEQTATDGRSNQRATTIWNDQTQVEPTRRASDDWLNAIHQNKNLRLETRTETRSENMTSPYLLSSGSETNANTRVANKPAGSHNAMSVDATSPEAWSVPDWNGSNHFSDQSRGTSRLEPLLSNSNLADQNLASSGEASASNVGEDSFWNRPLVGPQNDAENKFADERFDANSYPSNRYENELTDSTRTNVMSSQLGNRQPSPFGQVEAPAVKRIDLPAGPERTHVVTDGDTLPLLAERYLGDAGRAQELYQLNQDRLQHPDLLPIGIILRTPQAPARRAHTSSNTIQSDQPYTAAYRGNLNSVASEANEVGSYRSAPFSTISGGASESINSMQDSNHRQSQLVPIGQSVEQPAAPAPTSVYHNDWSW